VSPGQVGEIWVHSRRRLRYCGFGKASHGSYLAPSSGQSRETFSANAAIWVFFISSFRYRRAKDPHIIDGRNLAPQIWNGAPRLSFPYTPCRRLCRRDPGSEQPWMLWQESRTTGGSIQTPPTALLVFRQANLGFFFFGVFFFFCIGSDIKRCSLEFCPGQAASLPRKPR